MRYHLDASVDGKDWCRLFSNIVFAELKFAIERNIEVYKELKIINVE